MNKSTNGKYDEVSERFWSNVESVMRERGMSWVELASKLGIDRRTMASKKSSRSNVSIGSAKEMAEAMGTSIERLVYGDPNTQ